MDIYLEIEKQNSNDILIDAKRNITFYIITCFAVIKEKRKKA
jgi:hypothetical protein